VTTSAPAVIASYTRSGFTESVHRGHAVVVDHAGSVIRSWGDPDHVIFPRSAAKPAQAAAMVRNGLDLPDHLLALAVSSHGGERVHLAGVHEILELAHVGESVLQTPVDYPLDPRERDVWVRDGRSPSRVAMTCSGKHAAMLLTCRVNEWPTDTYCDPEHPLQQAIRWQVEALAGEAVQRVGVDGCGAPVLAITVTGLARTLSRTMTEEEHAPARRVGQAMVAFPEFVGGAYSDVTHLMRAVPGLVAKQGFEGVGVAALPDGTAVAVKVEDGSERARQVALTTILADLGVDRSALESLLTMPVLGGSAVVGQVASLLGGPGAR
jgi:L-asparaginase II